MSEAVLFAIGMVLGIPLAYMTLYILARYRIGPWS